MISLISYTFHTAAFLGSLRSACCVTPISLGAVNHLHTFGGHGLLIGGQDARPTIKEAAVAPYPKINHQPMTKIGTSTIAWLT